MHENSFQSGRNIPMTSHCPNRWMLTLFWTMLCIRPLHLWLASPWRCENRDLPHNSRPTAEWANSPRSRHEYTDSRWQGHGCLIGRAWWGFPWDHGSYLHPFEQWHHNPDLMPSEIHGYRHGQDHLFSPEPPNVSSDVSSVNRGQYLLYRLVNYHLQWVNGIQDQSWINAQLMWQYSYVHYKWVKW